MNYSHFHRRSEICNHFSETLGCTPVLQLPVPGYDVRLLLKLEFFNPMGNMKFLMARSMIEAAERSGELKPGGKIIESTSGNTGLGLATIAAERGYDFTAIVDQHSAKDKLRVMQALGTKLIFVDDGEGLSTAAREDLAKELAAEDPDMIWTEQHNNPANSAGYSSLAKELLETTGAQINALVGSVGTGGSLCGTARVLRESLPDCFVLGVEPEGSIAFGGPGGPYHQSGTGTPEGAEIGACVDFELIDKGIKVGDIEAFNTARYVARRFGVLLGGSAGGALYGAVRAITDATLTGTIAVIIPDGGEKYLDTIYDDDWMANNSLLSPAIHEELDMVFGQKIA